MEHKNIFEKLWNRERKIFFFFIFFGDNEMLEFNFFFFWNFKLKKNQILTLIHVQNCRSWNCRQIGFSKLAGLKMGMNRSSWMDSHTFSRIAARNPLNCFDFSVRFGNFSKIEQKLARFFVWRSDIGSHSSFIVSENFGILKTQFFKFLRMKISIFEFIEKLKKKHSEI